MANEDLIETLKGMVRKSVMKMNLEIKLEDNLKDDLGMDSMGKVELIVLLESHFEIEISNDDLRNVSLFKDLIEVVEKIIAGKA